MRLEALELADRLLDTGPCLESAFGKNAGRLTAWDLYGMTGAPRLRCAVASGFGILTLVGDGGGGVMSGPEIEQPRSSRCHPPLLTQI